MIITLTQNAFQDVSERIAIDTDCCYAVAGSPIDAHRSPRSFRTRGHREFSSSSVLRPPSRGPRGLGL